MLMHISVICLIGIYDVPDRPKWLLEHLGVPRDTEIQQEIFLIGADEEMISVTIYTMVNLAVANALGLDVVYMVPAMLAVCMTQWLIYLVHGLTPSYVYSLFVTLAFISAYLPAYVSERRMRHVFCLR